MVEKSVIDCLAVVASFTWTECSHLEVVYVIAISMDKMDLQHTKVVLCLLQCK